jgi:hypothetical protein
MKAQAGPLHPPLLPLLDDDPLDADPPDGRLEELADGATGCGAGAVDTPETADDGPLLAAVVTRFLDFGLGVGNAGTSGSRASVTAAAVAPEKGVSPAPVTGASDGELRRPRMRASTKTTGAAPNSQAEPRRIARSLVRRSCTS